MRSLFLRWALLNVLVALGAGAAAVLWGGSLAGSSLVAVPAIGAMLAIGSAWAGLLSWRAEGARGTYVSQSNILHQAEHLVFGAWVCQMMGILCTIAGFWILLHNGDTDTLSARIQSGAGVALIGSFAGVFASVILRLEHHMLVNELAPRG